MFTSEGKSVNTVRPPTDQVNAVMACRILPLPIRNGARPGGLLNFLLLRWMSERNSILTFSFLFLICPFSACERLCVYLLKCYFNFAQVGRKLVKYLLVNVCIISEGL